jgi:DNA-binding transcriptional regulator YhcF (GntR family)
MQLWFAHGSDVSIRQQLVTQVILGILSDDLAPGQRLPSTRKLARRFHLHPNTVSAGYRQLQREGWVDLRRGSGVYVRDTRPAAALAPALALDQMVANLFRSARGLGVPLAEVRAHLGQWLELQPPDHFLLVEPDEELRKILVLEMRRALTRPVRSCSLKECRSPETREGSILAALPKTVTLIRPSLPAKAELLTLQLRSVPSSLAGYLPAPAEALVGVASRLPEFLKIARTILIAAGFHADRLVLRDARKPRWQRGLEQTAAVICDVGTATELPKTCRTITFPLLAESSITELQRYEEFVRSPFAP